MEYNGSGIVAMTGKNCVAIASDMRFGIQQTTLAEDFHRVFYIYIYISISIFIHIKQHIYAYLDLYLSFNIIYIYIYLYILLDVVLL